MGTFETIAIVTAVYAVVFLAHQASRAIHDTAQRGAEKDSA